MRSLLRSYSRMRTQLYTLLHTRFLFPGSPNWRTRKNRQQNDVRGHAGDFCFGDGTARLKYRKQSPLAGGGRTGRRATPVVPCGMGVSFSTTYDAQFLDAFTLRPDAAPDQSRHQGAKRANSKWSPRRARNPIPSSFVSFEVARDSGRRKLTPLEART